MDTTLWIVAAAALVTVIIAFCTAMVLQKPHLTH